ncbi:hypothetical protein PR202_ga10401 [Eleusine coracana subsp. coracana]|uniref:X8 domain-containing protein n=1 Tax=Eleusine coracana subsp. coracana TaxID=191504 RepID=A0AAV5C6Q6_ELECO|nr:hypothetical protein PR202_ga10401 [Eleusine coracana subsp. coracana]
MLTTISVSKPSYPTVTTPMPMSATADPDTEPGSPSPAFPSLAAGNGNGGGGGSWCVASASASPTALQVALDYACGYGADCSPIQQGGSCFNPDTVKDHASYAFNSYYQKNPAPTSCDFGGTATLTTTDPSSGSCQYPSSGSGQGQTTMPPPSPYDDADRPDDPDADGPHDPDLAGHHHPDHRNPHVRRDVSSRLRFDVPSQLRIKLASGLQRRRRRHHDRAGQRRAGTPLRPSSHDISAHLQMRQPFEDGNSTQQFHGARSWWQKDTHAKSWAPMFRALCPAPGRAELRICLALSEA